jgi:hypothetical protein
MSFSFTPAVSVAVDPEVSVGQFANALSRAGLRIRFADGLLRVSRDELASIAVPPPTLNRETSRGVKARRSRPARSRTSTKR